MQGYIDLRKVKKPLDFSGIVVEIGFGSGDYLVKTASENKDKIFFGIEKSWISINKLYKKVKACGLNNIFFSRVDAYWAFYLLFKDQSVERIIINYPDPWFKKSHTERRVTKRQNLYLYAKKLVPFGEIRIRTDDSQLLEFTVNEAKALRCFLIDVTKPEIQEPQTKYEKKWFSMGKIIYDIVLRKQKDPEPIEIKRIKEVDRLFPVKISVKNLNVQELIHREFKIRDGVYIKFFSVWERASDFALETLISENGFLQCFFVIFKRKNDHYVVDVSAFSEVLKTEGIQEALNFIGSYLNKKLEIL